MSTRRVAVFGAAGRLGSVICAALAGTDDLELVAGLGRADPRERVLDAGAQVAVDVTHPAACMDNVRFCVEHGVDVVVGTSGIDAEREALISGWLSDAPGVSVLVAPNFSVGAVLMMSFARQAAAVLRTAEIVELHHAAKVDAPSGTAARTAALIAQEWARGGVAAGGSPGGGEPDHELAGARGAQVSGVPVHSVRLPGLVAHQEVIFGGDGQILTIRHDSTSPDSFAAGALLGIRRVGDRPGLTVGLEHLLGLA